MSKEKIPRKTQEELSRLAIDIFSGKVFHTLARKFSHRDIGRIFPLLTMGALDPNKTEISDIGLIYEYLSEAGPIQCNDEPIFLSCNFLHKDDVPIVGRKVDKLHDAAKEI